MQSSIIEVLKKQFKMNTNVNAYVVQAEQSLIPTILLQCAIVAMCEKQGCDVCSCCKKIKNHNHADVFWLPDQARAKNNDKLLVEDIALLVEKNSTSAIDGNKKVFLLDATQRSLKGVAVANWQNKLLKTLEEPNPGILIFIGVENAQMLLPTVVSRCQVLTATRANDNQMNDLLKKSNFNDYSTELAYVLSNGSVSKAEKILSNNVYFDVYEKCLDLLSKMTSTKVALPYSSMLVQDKDNIAKYFEILPNLLMQSVFFRTAPEHFLLNSRKKEIQEICNNYSIEAALAVVELLNKVKKKWDKQAHFQTMIDNLLVSMLEVKYKCRT